MLVKDYMTRHPILIEPEARLTEAQKLMVENHIDHLPVVGRGKRLIGLITRGRLAIPPEKLSSLDVWEITRFLAEMTVSHVMLKGEDLISIGPEATLEEAADLMIRHRISGLPVLEEGIVTGIITKTDLLIELQNLLGAIEPGWRVTMRVPDRNGEFRKLIRVIADKGWGLMAMGSVRSPKHPDRWDIIVKIRHCGKDELLAALNTIADQEIADIRETAISPPPGR